MSVLSNLSSLSLGLRCCNQQRAVTRSLSQTVQISVRSLLCCYRLRARHMPAIAALYSTPSYFHIINVGVTKAITLGLMTEATQGVKHDTRTRVRRRKRVVIHGWTSHMMGSSLPDWVQENRILLSRADYWCKFQRSKLTSNRTIPDTRHKTTHTNVRPTHLCFIQ